jgi:hypothetical protein
MFPTFMLHSCDIGEADRRTRQEEGTHSKPLKTLIPWLTVCNGVSYGRVQMVRSTPPENLEPYVVETKKKGAMLVLYIPGLAYAKVRSETRIVLALIHVFIGIYMLL